MDPDFLARIPTSPGVYMMKDKKGRVIYVGKAKDLRARVRAYFRPSGDERAFVALGLLGRLIGDIDTVVVNNEKEALPSRTTSSRSTSRASTSSSPTTR